MSETIYKNKCQTSAERSEEIPQDKNNDNPLEVDNQRKKLTKKQIILIISISSVF